MAPKKKTNKKNDDWESELGETIDPIAAATAAAKAAEDAQDSKEADPEEEFGGGGLMATMKKNRKKAKAKGKTIDEDEEAPATPMEEMADLSVKAPEEANLDDEFALPDKKGKGGKPAAGKTVSKEEEDDEEEEKGADGKILTKKEKEKLKKEREKQRKKEQAAAKKKTGPVKTPAPAAATIAKDEPKVVEDIPSGAAKGKKVPAAIRKLQEEQERRRKLEEEKAAADAAERARLEEIERQEAEDLKRREEAKILKKQREKEKIEQLKKEGKFLTKQQKEEKVRNEMKLQQMLAAGIKVGGLDGEATEKKKVTYDSKRKGGKKNPAQLKAEEDKALAEAKQRAQAEAEKEAKAMEEKARQDAEAAAIAKEAEESELEDDWEVAAADDDDELKDEWDADSEDEAEKAAAKAKAKAAVIAATRTKADEDSDADSESEEDSDEDDSSEDEEETEAQRAAALKKKEAADRREKAHQEALAARSKDNLRSPICCILGHVDTGKTKLLDKIRQTNVQEGEAGGITQQIGATFFPVAAIRQKTAIVNKDESFEFKVPGLLVIDTPGHESFSNLRSRGSSLCNIAILVVDIMHGLEPQTLESMKLLRDRKTPFIVALNKIDRLYGWKPIANNGFQDSLAMQNKAVQGEFAKRLADTKVAFAEQGFNAEVFYENKSMSKFVSLVPTSAHTGEGIPDMLKLIIQLTQERMVGSLMYLSEVQCTVLEVKAIQGFGMTIDVVLSNGILREGDRIVLCGVDGPITTNVRALLTPAPMKELRLKSEYVHNKEVKAALGVKISAPDLDGAIAGSRLMVVGPDDDESDIEEEVMSDLGALFNRIEKSGRGVSVQASTLGSLEALLDFLKVSKIPVASVGIGPVFKRDVMQCGTMLEKNKEYAVMLCFDVKVDKEAAAYAEAEGIKIFTADIIYHLFDAFTAHMAGIAERRKEESKMLAVFPCVLRPVAVFNKTSPIVVGVDVVEGTLRIHTPIAAVKNNPITNLKEIVGIGRVTGIERDHKQLTKCKQGEPSVAVKIEMGSSQPTYGRHLEEKDMLFSQISRKSIDVLKEFYRDEVSKEEWKLIVKLKDTFDIA